MLISLCGWRLWECITDFLGNIYNTVMQWFMDHLNKAIIQMVSKVVLAMVEGIGEIWTKLPGPNLDDSNLADFIHGGDLNEAALAGAVFGLLVAGVRMMYTRRRAETLRETLKHLAMITAVVSLIMTMLTVLMPAFDDLSTWFITDIAGHGGNLGDAMSGFWTKLPEARLVLVILFGLAAIIAAALQILMMIFRSCALILTVSTLPLAASMTNTEMGKMWFKSNCGYILALAIYKPAAAFVYAAAIAMAKDQPPGAGTDQVMWNAITGITMMVLAVVLMPAMMRLVAPASQNQS